MSNDMHGALATMRTIAEIAGEVRGMSEGARGDESWRKVDGDLNALRNRLVNARRSVAALREIGRNVEANGHEAQAIAAVHAALPHWQDRLREAKAERDRRIAAMPRAEPTHERVARLNGLLRSAPARAGVRRHPPVEATSRPARGRGPRRQ